MELFRQRSVEKRVAISVIALYALMLQAFFAAASPAAFASMDGSNCAQDLSGAQDFSGLQTPGGKQHAHHGLCCILACAASGCAYLGIASAIAAFPARLASPLVWASTPTRSARAAQKFYFAARGPPRSL